MIEIYHNIDNAVKKYGLEGNYVAGANRGFEKVANAMIAQARYKNKLIRQRRLNVKSIKGASLFYKVTNEITIEKG